MEKFHDCGDTREERSCDKSIPAQNSAAKVTQFCPPTKRRIGYYMNGVPK